MLQAFNLPSQWIQLINSCLNSMEYVPIINGHKTSPFNPARDIRQGDTLSPYLFIIAMEYRSIQIKKKIVTSNLWKPFKLRSHHMETSHFLLLMIFFYLHKLTINPSKPLKIYFMNSAPLLEWKLV